MSEIMYQVLVGDALTRLRDLPDGLAHCVITSPPYWSLRDYGVTGQLGLEDTPAHYVAAIVAVFREASRVLRPDGTAWLNLGDAYCSRPNGSIGATTLDGSRHSHVEYRRTNGLRKSGPPAGLKHKDLVGLPWRVALALQADGWYLRQDCIWHKTNPQPEAVRDRPSRDHEYVFLLARSERYFYDAEAVRQPVTGNAHARGAGTHRKSAAAGSGIRQNASFSAAVRGLVESRNLRSVWTFPTQPNPEAHFAAFPEELPARCILAGTSDRGCCSACGAQVRRLVERERTINGEPLLGAARDKDRAAPAYNLERKGHGRIVTTTKTVGWEPGCDCGAGLVPATVLDPFAGTSTTGVAALKLGRSFLGIELNPEYAAISERRLAGVAPLFARVGGVS